MATNQHGSTTMNLNQRLIESCKRQLSREADRCSKIRRARYPSDKSYFKAIRKRIRRMFLLRGIINRLRTNPVKGKLQAAELILSEIRKGGRSHDPARR
jgi:hypothetical protein